MGAVTYMATEARNGFQSDMDRIAATADTHKRKMSKAEKTKYDIAEAGLVLNEARIIKSQAEDESRNSNGAVLRAAGAITGQNSTSRFHVTGEQIYTPQSTSSYFLDMLQARTGDSAASERLDRHTRMAGDVLRSDNRPELRAISTGAGVGGELVPPLWLIDNYVAVVRPARATADILTNLRLPDGTNVINIPKIATGTAVAQQTTQNTGINIQDITTTSIPAAVYTFSGGAVFALQLLEQSPIKGQMDSVILQDLMSDYARQIGTTVINGSGTGTPTGLLNVASAAQITYTSASPTFMGASALYSKIAQAVQTVQTTRYAAPTHIVMHPRRWAWLSVQVDSANRAVILPGAGGPLNASGITSNNNPQGPVGVMFNLPVIIDPNIPTNLGAGTNQDPIIVVKADDTWLYEGALRTEVFPQTYAGQMSILARCYNYVAMATRLSQSIAIINGTGLTPPTF
jgi:HK97 family phage major capsid protein